ncbi:MAG: hypothetical protein EBV82_04425 [Chitinophagia bacterium]|nr:hypothetical protein [Chitinophagia bacterium]
MILSDSAINKELYSKLKHDKIQINWNKNPIKMDLFLSFLTVDVTRSTTHLGFETINVENFGGTEVILGLLYK